MICSKLSKLISLTTIAVLVSSNSVYAKPENVYPVNIKMGDVYVDVVKVSEDEVSFQKCWFKLDKPCEQIGAHSVYRITDLKDQRFWERTQIAGSILGDALALVAVASSGFVMTIFGMGGVLSSLGPIGTLGIATMVGSPVITIAIAYTVTPLNPVAQTRQYNSVSEKVIADQDNYVKDINKFIEALDTVLQKI